MKHLLLLIAIVLAACSEEPFSTNIDGSTDAGTELVDVGAESRVDGDLLDGGGEPLADGGRSDADGGRSDEDAALPGDDGGMPTPTCPVVGMLYDAATRRCYTIIPSVPDVNSACEIYAPGLRRLRWDSTEEQRRLQVLLSDRFAPTGSGGETSVFRLTAGGAWTWEDGSTPPPLVWAETPMPAFRRAYLTRDGLRPWHTARATVYCMSAPL